MISTFNLSKLNSLLQDFHKITSLRITVFDDSFHELTAYPEQIAPCCRIIRTDPAAAAQCARCGVLLFSLGPACTRLASPDMAPPLLNMYL